MKLIDLKPRPTVAVLGEAGSGKTYLLGTLCQLLPTIVLSSDLDGLDTLIKMKAEPVEIIHITDWRNAWDYLDTVKEALQHGVRAIAVDDFGSSQETIRRKAMMMPRSRDEERMKPADREASLRRAFLLGDRRLQFQGWQEVAESGRDFIWELRQLPYQYLMVNMLEGLRQHPRTGEDHLFPELDGRLRETILARFSVVLELFYQHHRGQEYWCGTTRAHPRTSAKDRVGTPRTWTSPTAAKLLVHIMGKEAAIDAETETERQIGVGITS